MNKIFKLYTILLLGFSTCTFAQVGIETTQPRGSALLDFPVGQGRGLILPKAQTPVASVGSMVMNVATGKVEVYDGTAWKALNSTAVNPLPTLDNTGLTEKTSPTVIGATTTAANGSLVLESSTKALVLPWVANPHLTIIKPEPGTICYDTASKSIAVYNGIEWSYWK